MNAVESNRVKTLFLSKRQLMEILSGKGFISNIPDYTKIIDMREENLVRRGFLLLLEHPSFPETSEGFVSELFNAEIEYYEKSKNRKLHFD